MKAELNNKLMVVATRGQTGSDGPATSTPNTAAPACHNVNVTTVSEAGSTGRCGERAASTDPTASAVSGTQTLQTGNNTRSTQMGPHYGQDSPGCTQTVSLEQNLKTRIHKGIDLIL